MARPKKADDEKRTERGETSLTVGEKFDLTKARKAAGLSEAEFIRRRILNYNVPPAKPLVDAQLLSELNKIGVNVNQLAAATHMDREFVAYWEGIGAELEAIIDKVAERL